MFKIVKNIKNILVITKRLKLLCCCKSYEILYGGRIYNLNVDAVVVLARYLLIHCTK